MLRKLVTGVVALGFMGTATAFAADCTDDLVAKGEKVYNKCKACHMIGDNAKNRVGPMLTGIVDKPIASVEGFKYSDAMIAYGEGGAVWDTAKLDEYLANPRDVVKGTKMAFPGLKKEEDRLAVVCYLGAN